MKVSVIIPSFNEEKTIIKLLNNVNQQKKKFDLEIIVSDDGSNDNTKKLLKENKSLFDNLVENSKNEVKGQH